MSCEVAPRWTEPPASPAARFSAAISGCAAIPARATSGRSASVSGRSVAAASAMACASAVGIIPSPACAVASAVSTRSMAASVAASDRIAAIPASP